MIAQPELDFTPRKPAPPTGDEVARLLSHLRECSGWQTAKQLSAALGFRDRKIRQLAEKSGGEVVSAPGSSGYKHITRCTGEEISHAADQLRSQGRRMLERSIRLRRAAHNIIAK